MVRVGCGVGGVSGSGREIVSRRRGEEGIFGIRGRVARVVISYGEEEKRGY